MKEKQKKDKPDSTNVSVIVELNVFHRLGGRDNILAALGREDGREAKFSCGLVVHPVNRLLAFHLGPNQHQLNTRV